MLIRVPEFVETGSHFSAMQYVMNGT